MVPAPTSMSSGSGRPKRSCSLRAGYSLPSHGHPPSTTKTRADALSLLVSVRTSSRDSSGSSRCAAQTTFSPRSARTWCKILMLTWWSLIRASVLVILGAQRQNARRGIDKYKVPAVARPPLHITKECVLQRLRARVTEEALRVPEQYVLKEGILFAGVLGHVQEEHIVLSAAF
jgi:hypothetical protein